MTFFVAVENLKILEIMSNEFWLFVKKNTTLSLQLNSYRRFWPW